IFRDGPRIQLAFGAPVAIDDLLAAKGSSRVHAAITDRTMLAIRSLAAEARAQASYARGEIIAGESQRVSPDLEARVREVVGAAAGRDVTSVRADTSLFLDLGMDSLAFAGLLERLERALGTPVSLEAAAHLETIADLLAFARARSREGTE